MHFKSIFRFIILLLIIISLSQLCSADVEIPFDYYYGRWVDGHQIGGFYEDKYDGEDRSRQINYLFTNDKYQIGFDLTTRYDLGIRGYGDDGWVTPNLSLQLRPNSHWQIGIDQAYFSESGKTQYYYQKYPSYLKSDDQSGHLSLSSHWINKNVSTLPDYLSMYSYYVTPLVSQGILKFDFNYKNNWYTTESSYWRTRYDSTHNMHYDEARKYLYSWGEINGRVQYGLNEHINSILIIDYSADRTDFDYVNYAERDNDYKYQYTNDEYKLNHYVIYDLSIIASYTHPLYIHASVSQQYQKINRRDFNYRFDLIDDTDFIHESTYNIPFQEIKTDFSIGMDFLTTGEYNEKILLDDYNNFYGKMLFNYQFYSGLTFYYRNEDIGKEAQLNSSIAYGLLGNIEFRTNLNYGWHEFYSPYSGSEDRSREYISSEIIFKYRSYNYHQNNRSGWDQDDKYDIILGEILDFGEMKCLLRYQPPGYYNTPRNRLSFLSFYNLISDEYSSLNLSLSVGMGKGVEVEFRDSEYYQNLKVYRRNYNLYINKRILKRYKFSLGYIQGYRESNLTDPTFKAELQALF